MALILIFLFHSPEEASDKDSDFKPEDVTDQSGREDEFGPAHHTINLSPSVEDPDELVSQRTYIVYEQCITEIFQRFLDESCTAEGCEAKCSVNFKQIGTSADVEWVDMQ